MLQSTFLARQARAFNRKQLIKRLTKAFFYGALCFLFGLSFCVFGWTAANIAPPVSDPNFPLPGWWWTASMVVICIGSFFATMFYLFAMLDELFYPANDRRRILKKH